MSRAASGPVVRYFTSLLAACCLAALPAWSAEESAQFSEANQLLFFQDHLANVETPGTLVYQLERESTFDNDESYSDRIEVNLTAAEGGRKDATVNFLTGARHRATPDLTALTGNPILTLVLQRDIYGMEKRLDSSVGWRHFQKRIKVAFEEDASVSDKEIEYRGRTVGAKEIVVTPFSKDPMAERYPVFRDKQYRFVLSDSVPGAIYSIFTEVTDPGTGKHLAETITLQ